MQRQAQQRGFFNKLREKTNLTGRVLEGLNPEFSAMMSRLRNTDEKIREAAAGIKVGVKQSIQFANRRDYLAAATNISTFHERCRIIAAYLKRFEDSVNLKHYQFLLDQFDDDQKEKLFGYDPNRELALDQDDSITAAMINTALIKNAGLSDWFFSARDTAGDSSPIERNRSREVAMKALEKRFNIAFLKQLKGSTNVMVIKTQQFSNKLLGTFKKLASALATRHIDQYISIGKEFIKSFARYHQMFVKYYTTVIVPLKDQHQKIIAEKAAAEKAAEKAVADKVNSGPYANPLNQDDLPKPNQPVPQTNIRDQGIDTQDHLLQQQGPDEVKEDHEPFALKNKKSNEEFLNRLNVYASRSDSSSMIKEMLSYSAALEDYNTDDSLKLLAVAEGMIEDMKKVAEDKPKKPNILDQYLKEKPKVPKQESQNDTITKAPPPPLA